MQANGMLHGQGQGLMTTKDGDMVAWTGSGLGKPTGKGMGARYRATVYYQTTSPRLAALNDTVGLIEHEVDENGNAHTRVFGWK